MRDQSQRLRRQVERVVRRGNCSGCGACAALSSSLRNGTRQKRLFATILDGAQRT